MKKLADPEKLKSLCARYMLQARIEELQFAHDVVYSAEWHTCDQHRAICKRLLELKAQWAAL